VRIAIVARNAFGMISGNLTGHIGGVERQTALMARWLAGRGHHVSLITWNEGGPAEEIIDRVRVIKTCRVSAGLPILRFFVPRWRSLNAALRAANAELYYQNGAQHVTGQVAIWCRYHGRKFIFSAASDKDCGPWIATCRTLRESLLYRHGLHHADQIIVQTSSQAEMLRVATGLSARALPMPGEDFAAGNELRRAHPDDPPLLLLVGRISPEKNVEMFIELARVLHDMRFLIVGPGDRPQAYVRSMTELANDVPNLEFFGPADRQQLCQLYCSATALCCTSHYEGFPNTFIEAWSLGLPVISTVDPDRVIATHGLGAHVSCVDEMQLQIRQLVSSVVRRDAVAHNARTYFLKTHQLDVVMERFERVFLETI
jgi:glycosyltransferase involved in cell wall biosynthesis